MTATIGGALMLAGLAAFLWGARRGHSLLRSGGLLAVLCGFFAAFASLVRTVNGEDSPFLAAGLILGAAAVFRLMASFEQARRKPD